MSMLPWTNIFYEARCTDRKQNNKLQIESENSDGQIFHQYQQNSQPPIASNN